MPTPSAFTQKHGLQRPSLDYYAFRHLPYAQFQSLQVIYALFYQLVALPHCSQDINVIRHKARFWLTDLQLAYTGIPSHPITKDLQALLSRIPLNQVDWLNIITAVEMQTDGLLLENDQEIAQYADRLYGSLYRMIALVCCRGKSEPAGLICPISSQTLRHMAHARALLGFIQDPNQQGMRVLLPENVQTQVYTLFEQAIVALKQFNELKPLRILARLYQHQAEQPMVNLSPLKILWLSIRERLSS